MMVKKKLRLESFTKMQINDCPTMLQSKKDLTFFFFPQTIGRSVNSWDNNFKGQTAFSESLKLVSKE